MKYILSIFMLSLTTPIFAGEICDLITHSKLSLADFAENYNETDHFYFSDKSELNRKARLTIIGNKFEIQYEDYQQLYECIGSRNSPCVGESGDVRFISEARIDKSIGVVVEIERQISGKINVFSRGGVADSYLQIWKILSCR